MDDHITKPVDARRLLAAVAEHAGAGSRPPENRARPEVESAVSERPATAVIDATRALQRLQNNRALFARMIEQFDGEVALARGKLNDALARRDAGAVRYAAHRLRGQALALEAIPLAGALHRLEGLAGGNDWDRMTGALRAVAWEIDRLLPLLRDREQA